MPGAAILYDRDCGFCRWSLAKLLAWDRRGRLRPVALQEPEAAELLGGMGERERLASWHLVTAGGEVHSGGRALAPMLRLLPAGSPLAALVERAPGPSERAYRLVAARRGPLGRLIPVAAARRAKRRILRREAATPRAPSSSRG